MNICRECLLNLPFKVQMPFENGLGFNYIRVILEMLSTKMIPVFETFLYPYLLGLNDSLPHSMQDQIDFIAKYFKLDEIDLQERTQKGTTTKVYDRTQWSSTYLRKAGLVFKPEHRQWQLTEAGKSFMQTHPNGFTFKDLLAIDSFAAFVGGTKVAVDTVVTVSQDKTPTDELEEAYAKLKAKLADDILEKVMQQTPRFFEQVVVDVLKNMGYGYDMEDSCRTTQYSKDDGIDGIIKEDKLGLSSIYLQAKKWDPAKQKVSKPEVQKFVGALNEQGATKGVFITTSEFTKDARDYVPKNGVKLVLIDGRELADYMIEFGVGVSTKKTYDIKKIDSDYFEGAEE